MRLVADIIFFFDSFSFRIEAILIASKFAILWIVIFHEDFRAGEMHSRLDIEIQFEAAALGVSCQDWGQLADIFSVKSELVSDNLIGLS